MNESLRQRVVEEEVDRAKKRLDTQRLDDARAVIATVEGRRLVHWIVYEAGGLVAIVPPEEQGRRALATTIYQLLDAAEPGSPETIALEARKQRIADEAAITSAIADRSHEYD